MNICKRLTRMQGTFLFIEGPRSRCYRRTAALRLIVQPCDEDDEVFSAFPFEWSTGGMKLAGENRSTRGRICPSATLSTKNPTWTDPGPRPGLRGERPATNRLTHGTTSCKVLTASLGTTCRVVQRRLSLTRDVADHKSPCLSTTTLTLNHTVLNSIRNTDTCPRFSLCLCCSVLEKGLVLCQCVCVVLYWRRAL